MNIYAHIFDMKYVYALRESTELSYRVVHRTRSHFEEDIYLYRVEEYIVDIRYVDI